MDKLYAQAIYSEAQKDGVDAKALVANLAKHLKSVGREKLLPGILRQLQRIEQKNTKMVPLVEVAHKKDAATALKEAATYGITATEAVVNETLVTGWRASQEGKLVDRSGKSALISLYRNILTP